MTDYSQPLTNVNMNETKTVPLKRTRAKRSCDFCRKRKSRCDADTSTPCSNCKAWGYTCEFRSVRKKRGPHSVYVDTLEKKCKKMESLLTTLTKCSIKDLERNDFQFEGHVHPQSPIQNQTDSSSDEEADDFESIQSSTADGKQETTNDYDSIKYTGESSIGTTFLDSKLFRGQSSIPWPGRDNIVLKLMSQDELMIVRTEKSSVTGKSDMLLDVGLSMRAPIFNDHQPVSSPQRNSKKPTKSQLNQIIEIYFKYLHNMLPIVNKPKFLEHYHNPALSQPPSILTQAIFALSFRFVSQRMPDLMEDAHEFGDFYFRKVMHRLRDSARSRLCHVQAALLMALYLDRDEGDVESIQWCTVGTAIRMAQDLGLHRSCTKWDIPRSEIETRHRVFYCCYIMDRWLGARAGKPLTILDRDFDTDMPSPFEVLDDTSDGSENRGPPVYRPFILLIKLSEILGRVLKALYAPNAKNANSNAGLDDPTIRVVFEKRLQQWSDSMEESFEGALLTKLEKMNLQLFHYTVLLLLHRPFNQLSVAKYPHLEPIVAESQKACTYAAYKISNIAHQRQEHQSDPVYYHALFFPSCYIYTLFQSSLVLLTNALRSKKPKHIRSFYQSIELLQLHQDIEPAPRAMEILNMLASVNGFDPQHLLEEDGLPPISPKTTPPPTTTTPIDYYPKAPYIQHRMMNTSIIGGITPDIQVDLGIVSTRPPEPIYYPLNNNPNPAPNYPYFQSDSPYPTYPRPFPPQPVTTPVIQSQDITPYTIPSYSLPQAPQAYTAAYDPNMNVSPHTLPPSSLNWSDWDVYIGHQM